MKKRASRRGGRGAAALPGMPLAPAWLTTACFLTSFALPNLVFSNDYFFNTLHIMKWALTAAPLAILGAAAGFRLLRRGPGATGFRIDGFALVWLALLLFTAVQPLWAPPRSPVTLAREWFFFALLWLVYLLALNLAGGRLVRALLWGALANAVISVLFAELQIRGLSDSFFFILNTPGNYIANTGQQNMFALWMAIAGAGGAFLFMSRGEQGERRVSLAEAAAFLLTGVVFYGLIASTSRSGILSLAAALFVLFAFCLRREGKKALPRAAGLAVLFVALFAATVTLNQSRGAALMDKMEDVVEKPLSIANRDSIWAASWAMFATHPLKGVGLGQYKWNYIDATKEMKRRWPSIEPKYTHWAHNEFLQWLAEGGVLGAALMFFLWLWWGWSLARAFVRREELSPEAVWGSSVVALFFANALWTRPFHRIENAVWLALAFAVTNRELLRLPARIAPPERLKSRGGRLLGGVVCLVSIAGLVYLGNGVYGDRMLRIAAESRGGDVAVIMDYFKKAYRSPLVSDIAEREVGYFSVRLGGTTGNTDLIAEGLNALMRHFEKQPNVEDLNYLRDWAWELGDERFINHLQGYLTDPPASGGVAPGVSQSIGPDVAPGELPEGE